jgi:hypothetical protein
MAAPLSEAPASVTARNDKDEEAVATPTTCSKPTVVSVEELVYGFESFRAIVLPGTTTAARWLSRDYTLVLRALECLFLSRIRLSLIP